MPLVLGQVQPERETLLVREQSAQRQGRLRLPANAWLRVRHRSKGIPKRDDNGCDEKLENTNEQTREFSAWAV